MHGVRGFISNFSSRMVQETFLVSIAVLAIFLFICTWPRRFLFLRQYLPQEISMKWFMSFSSPNLVTNIKLAENYNNLAEIYIKKGDVAQAFAEYNKAIEVETFSAVLFYNRGCLYIGQGKFNLAIKDFIKAIKIDPKYVQAYDNLGFIYAKQGQSIQAVSIFTKAIEIDPSYSSAYYNREMVYYNLKEYDKAWGDVHKAEEWGIKDNPGFMRMLKRDSGRSG